MSRSWPEERREEASKPKEFCTTLPSQSPELWDEFEAYLKWRQLSPSVAKHNGWYPSRLAGDTVHRLVIPATATGANKYWQARAMMKEIPKDMLRWQSPYASRGDAIIVVWPLGQEPKAASIGEGPLDALAAAEAGLLGIGLMGMAPPAEAMALVNTMTHGLSLFA